MSMGVKSMDLSTLIGNVVQTTSNVGGDVGLALPLVGFDAPFRGLTAGTNVTLTVLGDSSVEIGAPGTGETNTASNVGAGTGVFKQKVGVDLEFKSFGDGINTTVTTDALNIEINVEKIENVFAVIFNRSGGTITKGESVAFDGLGGGIGVVLTDATQFADYKVSRGIGLAMDDILDNAVGLVLTSGVLDGLDTSSLTAGQLAYNSVTTPGAFQTAVPAYPNAIQSIGYVIVSHATLGEIYVNPSQVYGFAEDNPSKSVQIGGLQTGNIDLVWAGDGTFTTTLRNDPSANVIITLPNTAGTVALTSDVKGFISNNYNSENIGATDQYLAPMGGLTTDNATFTDRANMVPGDFTFSKMTVVVSVNGIASTHAVTLATASATNGNQTITIPASTTGTFQDVTNTDAIANGNLFAYRIQRGAGAGTLTFDTMAMEYVPT